ncbi:hypothetical protein BZA05DRAFT_422266 [Tricharina praecox]|uniref:uncharacterized protein n=1 Tax=Tricharina praecox TaxID=43433 RepID=UPI00221FB317|nr:uncharacterized protein BZA05DRAFT_422266 [Tricharina praecox]KAI5843172.1 hypothetical protein BZA05DRAFT_422266 [Tricharina praecox]
MAASLSVPRCTVDTEEPDARREIREFDACARSRGAQTYPVLDWLDADFMNQQDFTPPMVSPNSSSNEEALDHPERGSPLVRPNNEAEGYDTPTSQGHQPTEDRTPRARLEAGALCTRPGLRRFFGTTDRYRTYWFFDGGLDGTTARNFCAIGSNHIFKPKLLGHACKVYLFRSMMRVILQPATPKPLKLSSNSTAAKSVQSEKI